MSSSFESMRRFIKEEYPEAVITYEFDTKWGREIEFLPNPDADESYSCIEVDCKPTILTEF